LLVRLPKIQDQNLLMRCWCSSSGWGKEHVAIALPVKVANTSFMDVCNQLPVTLPKCNTKNCWRSVDAHYQDGAGSISLGFCLRTQEIPNLWMFATNRQLCYPRCKPKILDTLLMLIFKMWQWSCRCPCCLWRLPTTNCHSDYPRCKTKNRWHSIDVHLHDGAGSMSLLFLVIKAANTAKKDNDVLSLIFRN